MIVCLSPFIATSFSMYLMSWVCQLCDKEYDDDDDDHHARKVAHNLNTKLGIYKSKNNS